MSFDLKVEFEFKKLYTVLVVYNTSLDLGIRSVGYKSLDSIAFVYILTLSEPDEKLLSLFMYQSLSNI